MLALALIALVVQHLTVARVADTSLVVQDTTNDVVPAEDYRIVAVV